jgi:hypothetical protein
MMFAHGFGCDDQRGNALHVRHAAVILLRRAAENIDGGQYGRCRLRDADRIPISRHKRGGIMNKNWGFAVGIAIGVAIGIAMHHLAFGIGIGVAMGLAWTVQCNRGSGEDAERS